MPPSFNGFSLNDGNYITERWVFKGFAKGERELITAKISRREGIKLNSTDFTQRQVTLNGHFLTDTAINLQTLVDNMKKNVIGEEGQLVLETGRTFTATVASVDIPDQQYNQSYQQWTATFILSKPFAEAALLTANTPVVSGVTTFSGYINISGTLFNRPLVVYTPGSAGTGSTNITALVLYHVPTGLSITISGFNSGSPSGLQYQNAVTFNLDDFAALEGSITTNISGGFPKFEPGGNNFTLSSVGGSLPGGTVGVIYKPRYL